jgi:hypothetical protein
MVKQDQCKRPRSRADERLRDGRAIVAHRTQEVLCEFRHLGWSSLCLPCVIPVKHISDFGRCIPEKFALVTDCARH